MRTIGAARLGIGLALPIGMKIMLLVSILLSAVVLWALGCGGGGGGSNTTTGPSNTGGSSNPSGNVGATITLTSTGVSDPQPRIALGERLRITNNDSRAHQMLTTPHLVHTDCPALNSIDILAPGESKVSEPLTSPRGCGFHDHLSPDDTRFRGQVLVGLNASDPVPAYPDY